jgi:hypothetical protein
MVHFPHSMHADNILDTSSTLPLCSPSSIFLTLIPEYSDAVHVAVHEPQAIQRRASGSIEHNSSNNVLSTMSRLIAELGESLKPNPFIFKTP